MSQVIQDSGPRQPGESGSFYDFLESCLRHKNDMVTVEAARAICNLKDVTARELTPAVTVLQLMLSSSKPVIRFVLLQSFECLNYEQHQAWYGLSLPEVPIRTISMLMLHSLCPVIQLGLESLHGPASCSCACTSSLCLCVAQWPFKACRAPSTHCQAHKPDQTIGDFVLHVCKELSQKLALLFSSKADTGSNDCIFSAVNGYI